MKNVQFLKINSSKLSNIFYFLSTSFFWGSSWIIIKYQIGLGVHYSIAIFHRNLILMILSFLALCFRKYKIGEPIVKKIKFQYIFYFIIYGFFSMFLNHFINYNAMSREGSSSIIVVFACMNPIVIDIMMSLYFRIKISKIVILSSIFSFIGLGFFLYPDIMMFFNMNENLKTLIKMSLATSLSFVFGSCLANIFLIKYKKYDSIDVNFYSSLISTTISFIMCKYFDQNIFTIHSINYIISLLYLSVFSGFLANIFLLKLSKNIGMSKSGFIFIFAQLIAITISITIDAYEASLINIFGFCITLLSVSIAIIYGEKAKKLKSNLKTK